MDEHFADLFARYEGLAPQRLANPAARPDAGAGDFSLEPAVARSAIVGS